MGAFAFSCIGFALTTIDPLRGRRPAVTNATVLPLYFISGVFIPESEIPDGVLQVADLFPIRHFFEAFFTAWDPSTTGAGIEWGDLAVVAAWGLAGSGDRGLALPLGAAALSSRADSLESGPQCFTTQR